MIASAFLRACTSSPSVRETSPSTTRANFSPPGAAGNIPLRPPGAMVSMTGSSFPASSRGASASIETGDQVLVSFGRRLARTSRTVLVSGSAKNFPRLTPRAMAMRSSDPIDGVTWPFSAWEIRLGEKPVLAARARTDIPKPRRSCRIRSPTFTELIGGSSCCDAMMFHVGL